MLKLFSKIFAIKYFVLFSSTWSIEPSLCLKSKSLPQHLPVSTVIYPDSGSLTTSPKNPSRGLYFQRSYYASNPIRLVRSDLVSKRESEGYTLLLRLYYLDTCFNPDTDISQEILDDITTDFNTVRSSGLKVIIRFAYSDPNTTPDNTVHDASKFQLLSHISQVAPILSANENVILAIQAGFIGMWGEWHGSTNFDPDWDGRSEIVAWLLKAAPNTTVQLRTPRYKSIIYQPDVDFGTNQVQQSSFEESQLTQWGQFSIGGYVISTEYLTGSKSIKVNGDGGAAQFLQFSASEIPIGSSIKISGYSKAYNVSLNNPSDYAIYADITYEDNSNLFGQTSKFSMGTHDWEYKENIFWVPKSVKSISLYAMYRNGISNGYAIFDDVSVHVSTTTTGGPVVTPPIDDSTAHNNSPFARTGHHNDCFLASPNDFGTYIDDLESEYPYLNAETNYTIMGGETCAFNPPRSSCDKAKEELTKFHYTYLNSGYHQGVLASWVNDGCMDEIESRLGYRFVMKSGTFSNTATVGGVVTYDLTVQNTGYAAPVDPLYVEIVLRHSVTGHVCSGNDINIDARKWYGNETFSIMGDARLPYNMPLGTYDILLHIADSDKEIRNFLEYKIQVANDGGNMNEDITGYIKLLHSIVISSGEPPPGSSLFTELEVSCNAVSKSPSSMPSILPSSTPSQGQTQIPSSFPTIIPSASPSMRPSAVPSNLQSSSPSLGQTQIPSSFPSIIPSASPSIMSSAVPSNKPSILPSSTPSQGQTQIPSSFPTRIPSASPSMRPSAVPSNLQSSTPSQGQTQIPSSFPSIIPSASPSIMSSAVPSNKPSILPSSTPSQGQTQIPSSFPTRIPSASPSMRPSAVPSNIPSILPSSTPSQGQTQIPSSFPSIIPSASPSMRPSAAPSKDRSTSPSVVPSVDPVAHSSSPSDFICKQKSDCNDKDFCTKDKCLRNGNCSNKPIENCCRKSSNCEDNNICTMDKCSKKRKCVFRKIKKCKCAKERKKCFKKKPCCNHLHVCKRKKCVPLIST